MVQNPDTAIYPKAPKAAVAAGVAIFTLEPSGIAELLAELIKALN
jgi:chemotaxis response regulator CheB